MSHYSKLCTSTLALLSCGLLVSVTFAQDVEEDPMYGTANLDSGFTPDPYIVEIVAGGSFNASNAESSCVGNIANSPDFRLFYEEQDYALSFFVVSDFDTTLLINDPNSKWSCNDDNSYVNGSNAGIHFTSPATGQYDIWVGVYDEEDNFSSVTLAISEKSEEDWASLSEDIRSSNIVNPIETEGPSIGSVHFGTNDGLWPNDNECDDPRFTGSNMGRNLLGWNRYSDAEDCRDLYESDSIYEAEPSLAVTQTGTLEPSDASSGDRGYLDNFSFQGLAGQKTFIDLQSSDFDTYLILQSPDGNEFVNDDYKESTSRSLLLHTLQETGEYTVLVTSFDEGSEGSYTLLIDNNPPDSANLEPELNIQASLNNQAKIFSDGEYAHAYEVFATRGETLSISMEADDIDTFLMLTAPDGSTESNDDYNDSSSQSRITAAVNTTGTYIITATSFSAEDAGSYSLAVKQGVPEVEVEAEAEVEIQVQTQTEQAVSPSTGMIQYGRKNN